MEPAAERSLKDEQARLSSIINLEETLRIVMDTRSAGGLQPRDVRAALNGKAQCPFPLIRLVYELAHFGKVFSYKHYPG